MKLHYMGKYNLDPDSLPHGEHKEGAVKFEEVDTSEELAKISNKITTLIAIVLVVLSTAILVSKDTNFKLWHLFAGILWMLITMFPHELLHAICFKGDVYLYTNLKQGMLFVIAPEPVGKWRFIFLSLLPNLVFGFLPFVLAIFLPWTGLLLIMGIMGICCGAGDYYNVYNAVRQVPNGAKVYGYKFNSYWYIP